MNRIKEVLKEIGISQSWLVGKTSKSYNSINEYPLNLKEKIIEVLKKNRVYKIAV